jgi:hypothetical protein
VINPQLCAIYTRYFLVPILLSAAGTKPRAVSTNNCPIVQRVCLRAMIAQIRLFLLLLIPKNGSDKLLDFRRVVLLQEEREKQDGERIQRGKNYNHYKSL